MSLSNWYHLFNLTLPSSKLLQCVVTVDIKWFTISKIWHFVQIPNRRFNFFYCTFRKCTNNIFFWNWGSYICSLILLLVSSPVSKYDMVSALKSPSNSFPSASLSLRHTCCCKGTNTPKRGYVGQDRLFVHVTGHIMTSSSLSFLRRLWTPDQGEQSCRRRMV